jgi:hypothetical protein
MLALTAIGRQTTPGKSGRRACERVGGLSFIFAPDLGGICASGHGFKASEYDDSQRLFHVGGQHRQGGDSARHQRHLGEIHLAA